MVMAPLSQDSTDRLYRYEGTLSSIHNKLITVKDDITYIKENTVCANCPSLQSSMNYAYWRLGTVGDQLRESQDLAKHYLVGTGHLENVGGGAEGQQQADSYPEQRGFRPGRKQFGQALSN